MREQNIEVWYSSKAFWSILFHSKAESTDGMHMRRSYQWWTMHYASFLVVWCQMDPNFNLLTPAFNFFELAWLSTLAYTTFWCNFFRTKRWAQGYCISLHVDTTVLHFPSFLHVLLASNGRISDFRLEILEIVRAHRQCTTTFWSNFPRRKRQKSTLLSSSVFWYLPHFVFSYCV